jgi:hypothetical protein
LQVHLTELLSGLSVARFQNTLQQLRSGQERLARCTAFLDTWQPEPSPKSVLPTDTVNGHPFLPAPGVKGHPAVYVNGRPSPQREHVNRHEAVYVNGHPSSLRERVNKHHGDDLHRAVDVFLPLAELAQHETKPVRRLKGGSLEGACRQDWGSVGGCEITEGSFLNERVPTAELRRAPPDEKEATQRECFFGDSRRGGYSACPGRGGGLHVQVELQMLERDTLEPGSRCNGTVAGCSPEEDQEALLLATFCELPKSPEITHQQRGSEQGRPQAMAMLTVKPEVRFGLPLI